MKTVTYTLAIALLGAVSLNAQTIVTGDSYRTRADNGTYNNFGTSANSAYGWSNATQEWRTVYAFDLDATNDGVNDLAGFTTITLDTNFGNVPGAGSDDYSFVFLGTQGPQTSSVFGVGTNYPFNTLFFKNPVTVPGGGTFEQNIAGGTTTASFDVSFLADLSVTATDNVVFFQLRDNAADFASSTGARFGGELNPTLTAVPEPSAYALVAGALALGWIMVRRRR